MCWLSILVIFIINLLFFLSSTIYSQNAYLIFTVSMYKDYFIAVLILCHNPVIKFRKKNSEDLKKNYHLNINYIHCVYGQVNCVDYWAIYIQSKLQIFVLILYNISKFTNCFQKIQPVPFLLVTTLWILSMTIVGNQRDCSHSLGLTSACF